MDTPKKSSPVVSPLITDKLSPQELTKESNFGIPSLTANSLVKLTTTPNGFHVLDTVPSLKLKAKLLLTHISLQSVGMEDLKFGTLISKLEPLSNPMMDLLIPLLFPPIPNILPLEEETNN